MKPAIATMLMLALLGAAPSHADNWPMLGRDGTRNAVSPEKNPPTFWQVEGVPTKFENQRPIEWTTESKNIRWKAKLGINTFGTPVVADGLVWIGTTDKNPDVKRAGLLKCFRERDGKVLYEYMACRHSTRHSLPATPRCRQLATVLDTAVALRSLEMRDFTPVEL